jgi:hypothetical protein
MASVLPSLPARVPEFLKGGFAGSLSKIENTRQRPVDFFLPPTHLGYDSGDGASMTGNNNRFAKLHVIEQLGQMGFGFGSLDFTHLTVLTTEPA